MESVLTKIKGQNIFVEGGLQGGREVANFTSISLIVSRQFVAV